VIAEGRVALFARRLDEARALVGDGSALPARAGGYTRTLLYSCDAYEIVGFRWSPGARTPLHDHGISRCATLLMSGELAVERFAYDDASGFHEAGAFVMVPGDLDDADADAEFHRVTAAADRESITVHVYEPPLGTHRVVDAATGELALTVAAFTVD
jgi:predicted metal-dependent enzyme (double-stranded beta helix superfamily)